MASVVSIAPRVRVLSYNVLAQCLSKSSWFPYVKGSALKWKLRFSRLCNQIESAEADVICLSEVDEIDAWRSFFAAKGFEVVYKSKPGGRKWGSLLAFSRAKFELVRAASCDFNDAANAAHFGALRLEGGLACSPGEDVSPAGLAKDGVAVFAVLRPLTEALREHCDGVLVATTHLFWDPKAAVCKVAQAAQVRLCCEDLLRAHTTGSGASYSLDRFPIVIGGDLNSLPGDPAHVLLQTIALPALAASSSPPSMVPVWDRLASDTPLGCTLPPFADPRAQRPPPLAGPGASAAAAASSSSSTDAAGSAPTVASISDKPPPYWMPIDSPLPSVYAAWLDRLSQAVLAALREVKAGGEEVTAGPKVVLRSAYAARTWLDRRASGVDGVGGDTDLASLPARDEGLLSCEPAWTTMTADFRGCIDYIFYSVSAHPRTWGVAWTLPLPTEADVRARGDVAMPSETHPSDHCCLCADLAFA